ncbi:MAG: hypothetical protein CTY31_04095 [Hyphomicrobium sp.]|nr:MAG: hypothetical protein CTY31_04095 [Hyphomicrobium sp.]
MIDLDILKEKRGLMLMGATFATLLALTNFAWTREQRVLDVMAIVDVTGSMNARDGAEDGASRLEATRTALRQLVLDLPCGSRMGLGIFTERRTFALFAPADVCADYEAMNGAIDELDWRMAWEGDSYVARGLYDAITSAGAFKSNILFLTDGQEAPPLPASGIPDFEGKPGDVKGLIVGVGGAVKMPIPKYDDDGRETGSYAAGDVPHVNRHGLPGKGMENSIGWHPRNAPQGGDVVVGEEHLTSMRGDYLKDLASRTGMSFVDLASHRKLAEPLLSASSLRPIEIERSAAVFPASVALILAAGLFGLSLAARMNPKIKT